MKHSEKLLNLENLRKIRGKLEKTAMPRNLALSILEPAAHGMGAPQAFQNDLQNGSRNQIWVPKIAYVRHFSTSNRNEEKRVRSLRGAESIKLSKRIA